MDRTRVLEIWVGLFVALGLAALFMVIVIWKGFFSPGTTGQIGALGMAAGILYIVAASSPEVLDGIDALDRLDGLVDGQLLD